MSGGRRLSIARADPDNTTSGRSVSLDDKPAAEELVLAEGHDLALEGLCATSSTIQCIEPDHGRKKDVLQPRW